MNTENGPATQPRIPPKISPKIPPIISPQTSATSPSDARPKSRAVVIAGAAIAVAATVLGLVLVVLIGGIFEGDSSSSAEQSPRTDPVGFPLQQLAIATQTLVGEWVEEDVVVDDNEKWSGTTAVVSKSGDRLVLVTNSHCLGLGTLAQADSSKGNAPEVKDYGLKIGFPKGEWKPVLRVAETPRRLDIALSEVEASGLKEGDDYVVISIGREAYKVGDDVVAVGNPLGFLADTHTFGRISAVRTDNNVQLIQHHADINPGNSGGPLFLKTKSDRYVWIGVNTRGGGNGLGFAIDANEVFRAQYQWFAANKHGAAEAIRKLYGQPDTEVR